MGVVHFFLAGGFVMWPLLALSIAAVAVIVERLLAYRAIGAIDRTGVATVIAAARERRGDEAARMAEELPGVSGACLRAALARRADGPEAMERAVQETGEEEFTGLERYLPILETTTTISPLLGLLGTLVGMIGTFQAIAASRNQGANDQILAGVGEALYATATGLTIAVVCFVAYNFFSARGRAIVAETELAATKTINGLAGASGGVATREPLLAV